MASYGRETALVEYGERLPVVTAESKGLKAMQTTGSIAAGSYTITNIPDTSAWNVLDRIIVECDQAPESIGVGGVWPALSYASKAAMFADTTQPNNTHAWIQGSDPMAPIGSVHYYNSGARSWLPYNTVPWARFYWDRAMPFALKGRIKSKTATTLTIDAPAQANATHARIFFDNWLIMNDLVFGGRRLQNSVFQFGAGSYAFSGRIFANNVNNMVYAGMGDELTTLISPRGTPSIAMGFYACNNIHIRDLHMLGNSRDRGYGTGTQVTASQTSVDATFTRSILFEQCRGGTNEANPTATVHRVKTTDPWTNAVGVSVADHIWVYDCKVYAPGHRSYIQWMFQWADSTGGGLNRCYVYGDKLVTGFETFRGTGQTFRNFGGVNCMTAVNSSGDWRYDNLNVIIEDQSFIEAHHPYEPVVNINSNIQPPSATLLVGGTLNLGSIDIQGTFGPQANHKQNGMSVASMRPIVINANNPNVSILGTYGQANSQTGLIKTPEGVHSLSGSGGRYGIASDGARGVVVKGIRIIGGLNAPGSTHVSLGATAGRIEDVVCNDVKRLVAASVVNPISNAAFVAQRAAYKAYMAAALR